MYGSRDNCTLHRFSSRLPSAAGLLHLCLELLLELEDASVGFRADFFVVCVLLLLLHMCELPLPLFFLAGVNVLMLLTHGNIADAD